MARAYTAEQIKEAFGRVKGHDAQQETIDEFITRVSPEIEARITEETAKVQAVLNSIPADADAHIKQVGIEQLIKEEAEVIRDTNKGVII